MKYVTLKVYAAEYPPDARYDPLGYPKYYLDGEKFGNYIIL